MSSATPPPTAGVDDPVTHTATVAAAPAAGNGDAGAERILQPVADDKIQLTSDWLRRHADIFTHLSAGLAKIPPIHFYVIYVVGFLKTDLSIIVMVLIF